jgi:hypothetical protein
MTPILCPMCAGTGVVDRPPGIPATQATWVSNSAGPWPCRICGGCGLIQSEDTP